MLQSAGRQPSTGLVQAQGLVSSRRAAVYLIIGKDYIAAQSQPLLVVLVLGVYGGQTLNGQSKREKYTLHTADTSNSIAMGRNSLS